MNYHILLWTNAIEVLYHSTKCQPELSKLPLGKIYIYIVESVVFQQSVGSSGLLEVGIWLALFLSFQISQIPYYTNVRKLCRYYNMFGFISFVMYNVEFISLSSYIKSYNAAR